MVKASSDEGDAVSSFPSLILRGGLLSCLAFALERKKDGTPKRDAHKRIADSIAGYLSTCATGENLVAPHPPTGDGLFQKLTECDASHLRRCTAESLEYLSYLKRFSK